MKLHSSVFSKESQFNNLEPIFLGAYSVIKCFLDSDNYTIKTPLAPSGQIKVHTSLLAPWFHNLDDQFPSRATPEPGPAIRIAEDSNEDRYHVDRIIKDRPSKQDKGTTEFLIKCMCYGVQHNTWEPEEDIDREIILDYIRSKAWPDNLQNKRAYKRGKQ